MSTGIDPKDLSEADLFRELKHCHATRFETLQHGGAPALEHHTERMSALETEYLRRHPDRDVDPMRTRDGARSRGGAQA